MAGSYKKTLVWNWLQVAPTDISPAFGVIIRSMRDRVDMNHQFATKTQLINYLHFRCKHPLDLIEAELGAIWTNWNSYREAVKSNTTDQPVKWNKTNLGFFPGGRAPRIERTTTPREPEYEGMTAQDLREAREGFKMQGEY